MPLDPITPEFTNHVKEAQQIGQEAKARLAEDELHANIAESLRRTAGTDKLEEEDLFDAVAEYRRTDAYQRKLKDAMIKPLPSMQAPTRLQLLLILVERNPVEKVMGGRESTGWSNYTIQEYSRKMGTMVEALMLEAKPKASYNVAPATPEAPDPNVAKCYELALKECQHALSEVESHLGAILCGLQNARDRPRNADDQDYWNHEIKAWNDYAAVIRAALNLPHTPR